MTTFYRVEYQTSNGRKYQFTYPTEREAMACESRLAQDERITLIEVAACDKDEDDADRCNVFATNRRGVL